MILCSSPGAQYFAHRAEIDEAIARVLASGWYILGEEARAFESEFASWLNVEHAVGVGSGTEALHIALAACGIGPGDEVITVSHTAVATVAAIEYVGATPILVDIEPSTMCIDPARVAEAVTERTRAVIPVHLYGQPAEMDAILAIAVERGLRVIEDCAQAHGATYRGRRVGTMGDVGCFSFYPTKNLGAIGDGGAVVTRDPAIAGRLRLLRQYGWAERYVSEIPGWNSRLDELQAAVLRTKLRYLDAGNRRRTEIASRYDAALAGLGLGLPAVRDGAGHVYHLYVVRSARRDELQAFLRGRGIQALVHYPVPVHLQPAYSGRVRAASLPETERAAREVLSLPMYPELTADELEAVAGAVRDFAEEMR